jgi:hypothetical protein
MFDISQFDAFIKATSISSVSAFGCTFINSYSSDARGIGISATESGVYVGAQCTALMVPCPESGMTHSVFSNLTRGVYGINTGSPHGASVSRSDFSGVTSGVYLSGYSSPEMILNTFNVPGSLSQFQPQIPPYGIYLDYCTGYHVEENAFESTDPTPNSAGIIINNSGTADNEIYRNTFTNLRYGSAAQDVNKHPSDGITGLCFVCNTYKSTDAEIVVTRSGNYSRSVGVSEYQHQHLSGTNAPPFNLFYANYAATHFDIFNNCYPFTYPYPVSAPAPMGYVYQPIHVSTTVSPNGLTGSFTSTCVSKIGNGGALPDKDATSGDDPGAGYQSMVENLKLKNSVRSAFELAVLYLNMGEVSEADKTLNSIPSQFTLLADERTDYLDFSSVYLVMRELRLNLQTVNDLSDKQAETLKRIMEMNHNLPGAWARNLLISGGRLHYQEPFIPPVFEEKSLVAAENTATLNIFPNPASNEVTVTFKAIDEESVGATICVYDMTGTRIFAEKLRTGCSRLVIQTPEWPSGLYLVSLETDGTVMESVKLNIVR